MSGLVHAPQGSGRPTTPATTSALAQRVRPRTGSLLLAAALAIAVTLGSWVALPASVAGGDLPDYVMTYEPAAHRLLNGAGLTKHTGELTLRGAPGYPVLLAGAMVAARWTGTNERVLVLAEILLMAAVSASLVYGLASALWGARRAWLATIVWVTYPLMVWTWRHPASEIAFGPVVLLLVVLFRGELERLRPRPQVMLLTGVLVGVATLIRPAALGLGLVLAAFVWFAGTRRLQARTRAVLMLCLLLGNMAVLTPFEVYVAATTGRWIPVSTNGAPSVRDGLTFAADQKGYRTRVWTPAGAAAVMRDVLERTPSNASLTQLTRVVANEAAEHPSGIAQLVAIKLARSWYATDSGRLEWLLLAIQLLYLPSVVAASFAAWQAGGSARRYACLAWIVAAYFWSMTVAVVPIARYMVPAMAVLLVLVGGIRMSGAQPAPGTLPDRPDNPASPDR